MDQTETARVTRRHNLFFWALAAISLLSFLGVTMLYAAEARYGEAVREMLLAQNWLQPTFNGVPLSPRPLFMHWMMIFCCRLTGVCSEFSLRLPGVLAGLLTLFAVRRMGTRLFDPECGAVAGYLMLGCFGFLFWSRSATAEMWNTCTIAIGMMWFYEIREKPGFWNLLALVLLFLLGSQFKGVLAVLALGVLLLPALLNRHFWAKLKVIPAIVAGIVVLLLAAGLIRYLPAPLEDVGKSLVSGIRLNGFRMFRQPFFYFRELPLLLLPWTLVFLLCAAGMLRNWKKQSREVQELLCGMLLMLVLLTLLPWTQGYYALGCLIPLTLCSAAALTRDEGIPEWNHFALKVTWTIAVLCASAATVSLLFLPFWNRILGYHPRSLLLVSIFLTGAVTLALLFSAEFDDRNIAEKLTGIRQRIAVPILAANLLCCGFTAVILPQYHLTRTDQAFFSGPLQKGTYGTPTFQFAYWGNPSLRFLFYFNRAEKVRTARSAEEISALWPSSQAELVLITQNTPEETAQLTAELEKLNVKFHPDEPIWKENFRPLDQADAVKYAGFRLKREQGKAGPKGGR